MSRSPYDPKYWNPSFEKVKELFIIARKTEAGKMGKEVRENQVVDLRGKRFSGCKVIVTNFEFDLRSFESGLVWIDGAAYRVRKSGGESIWSVSDPALRTN